LNAADKAKHLLAANAGNLPVAGGLFLATALQQVKLDYSEGSLQRIDALLDQVRERLKPAMPGFLEDPEKENFALTLAFYLGEYVAKACGKRVGWLDYDEAAKRLPAEHVGQRSFLSHVVGLIDSIFLMPLVVLEERLFSAQGQVTAQKYISDALRMIESQVEAKGNSRDLTPVVHRWLACFHAGRPTPDPLAFHAALKQLDFDYTPQAIARVDQLLRQVRERLKPVYADFVSAAENRSFMCLLAFFVGETVGRYRGAACRWLNYEGLLALLAERGLPASYPECFGTSLMCEVENEGFFFPLGAVEEALFGGAPRTVLAAADLLMRRAVDVPVLPSPADPSGASATLAADQAYLLGHAVGVTVSWCVDTALKYGEPMDPQFLQLHEGGRNLFVSMPDRSFDEAIEVGRSRLKYPEPGVVGQVLAFDGFIGLPEFRSDALVLESARYAATGATHDSTLRAVVALPYRAARSGLELGLHNFRLLEFNGDQEVMHRLHLGLFAGMDSMNPPGVWARYFEPEDSAECRSARQAAQPPLPWVRTNGAESADDKVPHIGLDDFDLQDWLRDLPASEQGYLDAQAPEWALDNPIGAAIRDFPRLLQQGRVVWGVVIQANMELFERSGEDRIAEVVYSTDGTALPALLWPIAHALFALRKQVAPADEPLLNIARYLDAERQRVFGWPVPQSLLPAPGLPDRLPDTLRISSLWVVRKHLPQGYLVSKIVPLLVSDACPGHVMVVPARAWPAALLQVWETEHNELLAARWSDAWASLARGRDEKAEQQLSNRVRALQDYAAQGVSDERMRTVAQNRFIPYEPSTSPPPMEWEWSIDGDLRSYAEYVLATVEAQRAQGKALDQVLARQAFAARATSQLILMHRLALARPRQMRRADIELWPDEIQYVALGTLVGCDDLALRIARLLIVLWRDRENYCDILRPEVLVIFQLFARHLGLECEDREPFARRPCLDALMQGEAWMGAESDVKRLMEAGCVEHTERAPVGPFRGLPIALALMLRLRELAGLRNPVVEHDLLRVALGTPQARGAAPGLRADLDDLADPLVREVRARMQRMGYDEALIEAAVLGGHAPETVVALARPLRLVQPDAGHGNSGNARAALWPVKLASPTTDALTDEIDQREGETRPTQFPLAAVGVFVATMLLCWGSLTVFSSVPTSSFISWMSFMVALLSAALCVVYVVWFARLLWFWWKGRDR